MCTGMRAVADDFQVIHGVIGADLAEEVQLRQLQRRVCRHLSLYQMRDIYIFVTGQIDIGEQNLLTGSDFFRNAPAMNHNRTLITGKICGVRVEEIEDPLLRDIRYLDKLVDELAGGKTLEKILRE